MPQVVSTLSPFPFALGFRQAKPVVNLTQLCVSPPKSFGARFGCQRTMRRERVIFRIGVLMLICAACVVAAFAQDEPQDEPEEGFGPVVSAYLGYLRNEQEVVDDRASRHEVSAAYYRRNSNRIRALREVAMRIAREAPLPSGGGAVMWYASDDNP